MLCCFKLLFKVLRLAVGFSIKILALSKFTKNPVKCFPVRTQQWGTLTLLTSVVQAGAVEPGPSACVCCVLCGGGPGSGTGACPSVRELRPSWSLRARRGVGCRVWGEPAACG